MSSGGILLIIGAVVLVGGLGYLINSKWISVSKTDGDGGRPRPDGADRHSPRRDWLAVIVGAAVMVTGLGIQQGTASTRGATPHGRTPTASDSPSASSSDPSGTALGAEAQTAPPTATSHDQGQPLDGATTVPDPVPVIGRVQAYSGLVLDVGGTADGTGNPDIADGAGIYLEGTNRDHLGQEWTFTQVDGPDQDHVYYQLTNNLTTSSLLSMDTTTDRASLATRKSEKVQTWWFTAVSRSYGMRYFIHKGQYTGCLAEEGNGQRPLVKDCSDADTAQMWKLPDGVRAG